MEFHLIFESKDVITGKSGFRFHKTFNRLSDIRGSLRRLELTLERWGFISKEKGKSTAV